MKFCKTFEGNSQIDDYIIKQTGKEDCGRVVITFFGCIACICEDHLKENDLTEYKVKSKNGQ